MYVWPPLSGGAPPIRRRRPGSKGTLITAANHGNMGRESIRTDGALPLRRSSSSIHTLLPWIPNP